ncbi:hypothetical protein ACFUOZ_19595 [Paenarthrobacter sp. NPDC057355]|uniref:hypothetical protein n=1 Tax=Paenarthrobacter sp. NPDC057355 TaxID=3346105 RepID=UPI00363245D0
MSRGKHKAVKNRKKQPGNKRRTAQVVAGAVLAGPALMLGVAPGANAADLGPTPAGGTTTPSEQSTQAPMIPGGQEPLSTAPEDSVKTTDPTDPVVVPTDPVVVPTDPLVVPTDPVVVPTDPVVVPTDPVVAPTDPVVVPTDPVVAPTDPVVVPTDPVVVQPVTPSVPAVPGTGPVQPVVSAPQNLVPMAAVSSGTSQAGSVPVQAPASVAQPQPAFKGQLANTGAGNNETLIGGIGAGAVLAGVVAIAASRRSKGKHSL